MKRFFLLIISLLSLTCATAQVRGVVLDDQGAPLVGANLIWAGTGKGTITDFDGNFSLDDVPSTTTLITSYMGFRSDTTVVTGHDNLIIVLVSNLVLDEVIIAQRKKDVVRDRISAFNTEKIGASELCKAACCNLSESFETSASVDVAYSDAATGAKQIRLLGLSGTYVQLLGENCPAVRGLAQNFGMEYIPGPWMESIQVSKGTSSVINGYEAITGQINVEYLKPQTQDPIAINLMLNTECHAELNVEGGWQIPLRNNNRGNLHTGILAHVQNGSLAMDDNADGFLDMPLNQNYNLLNRWYYKTDDYTFQLLVRGLYDRRQGGQHHTIHGDKHGIILPATPYLIDLQTYRVDGFMKNGFVFDHESGMSLGIITAASYHNQHNTYGYRIWNAAQTNAYLNAIFQNMWEGGEILGGDVDNDHKLSAGLSLNFDKYDEYAILTDSLNYSRWELVPGIFAEYSYKIEDQFSMIAGVRVDYSSTYGFFFTPRLNARYSPFSWWALRGSVGLGYRNPNILADNANIMPSSRNINTAQLSYTRLHTIHLNQADQEQSLNAGISTTFYIPMGSKELQLSADYYYTTFLNAVIADMDANVHQVLFYNLSNVSGAKAFSHNMQVEASMEVLRGWTITAAFRYTDAKQTTMNATSGNYELRDKPLTNKFKGIITTSYQTPLKKWQFDLTAQFNGGGRMPDGFADFYLNQMQSKQYEEKGGSLYYKWYPQLMGQITKYFRTCSIYLGAENMTNFRQDAPVVGNRDSQGLVITSNDNFDASMAWGPISGWKIYLGFRWALEKADD